MFQIWLIMFFSPSLFSRLRDVEEVIKKLQKTQVEISEKDADKMVQLWEQLKVFWEERLRGGSMFTDGRCSFGEGRRLIGNE